MSEYHDNSPESLRFAISALQDRLDKLTAPAASPETDNEVVLWSVKGKRVAVYKDALVVVSRDEDGRTKSAHYTLPEVHDALSSPAASPEVMEVDDAMVELALAAFDKEVGWNQNDYLGNSIKERNLDAMRAALTAALKGKK